MYPPVLKASVCAFALATLAGCAASVSLDPKATADVQQALGVGCPILAAVRASGPSLNAYQKAALNTLALACPPNPPPTSALVAIGDIVTAYATLEPLLNP